MFATPARGQSSNEGQPWFPNKFPQPSNNQHTRHETVTIYRIWLWEVPFHPCVSWRSWDHFTFWTSENRNADINNDFQPAKLKILYLIFTKLPAVSAYSEYITSVIFYFGSKLWCRELRNYCSPTGASALTGSMFLLWLHKCCNCPALPCL